MKVFAIRDSKAGAFLQPFFSPNKAVAIRSFERAVNEEGTDFHRWANDYCLFEIGEFDPEKGFILGYTSPENCGLGSEYVKQDVAPVKALREVK